MIVSFFKESNEGTSQEDERGFPEVRGCEPDQRRDQVGQGCHDDHLLVVHRMDTLSGHQLRLDDESYKVILTLFLLALLLLFD